MEFDFSTGDISELVRLVHSRYGMDLSKYRSSCIGRRVSHRMAMLGCHDLEEYMAYLSSNPDEMDSLLDVVTIHVTGFFRDHDVFDSLTKKVFPMLIHGKRSSRHGSIRIWSAGCSTGEETYSIAILLTELLHRERSNLKVEVFGTDISEESCKIARKGIYPAIKLQEVPRYIKEKYFEVHGSCYRVSPDIRRFVKFNVHDLFSRIPFSMLDLVVCRNVMIHFDQNARGSVVSSFYSSLSDGGILILGKSEGLTGPARRLFELIDPRNKIYRRTVFCASSKEE